MRKLQVVGLMLVAMFVFSAIAAASAFASEPEWLLDGNPITVAPEVLSEGELALIDTKGGLFLEEVEVLCSGLDEGSVGPGASDVITDILSLAGALPPIACTTDKGICPEPLVTPLNLSLANKLTWLSKLELGTTDIVDDITASNGGGVGYTVVCSGVEDKCESALTLVLIENLPAPDNDVDAIFLPVASGGVTPAVTCTRGGAESGLVIGSILIFEHEHTLAVSGE